MKLRLPSTACASTSFISHSTLTESSEYSGFRCAGLAMIGITCMVAEEVITGEKLF